MGEINWILGLPIGNFSDFANAEFALGPILIPKLLSDRSFMYSTVYCSYSMRGKIIHVFSVCDNDVLGPCVRSLLCLLQLQLRHFTKPLTGTRKTNK